MDFTKSNSWQGERSFNNQSLHALHGDILTPYNPYQQVIATLSDVLLKRLDDDCSVPMYGQSACTALAPQWTLTRRTYFGSAVRPGRSQLTLVALRVLSCPVLPCPVLPLWLAGAHRANATAMPRQQDSATCTLRIERCSC